MLNSAPEDRQDGVDAAKTKWLARLESELRRRTGWIDEVVSPFARRRSSRESKPTFHQAA